jgi:hypothetical protein
MPSERNEIQMTRYLLLIRFLLLISSFSVVPFVCWTPSVHADEKVPYLKIPRLKTEVKIDGNLDEDCYKKNKPFTNFRVTSDPNKRPPLTRAWVFWREDKIVFAYDCVDKKVCAEPEIDDEMAINGQDCVELFLWSGQPKDLYLCLELAPLGTVLDYLASFKGRFQTEWDAKGLKSAAVVTDNGYRVEVELPAENILPLGIKLVKGAEFYAGLFRGDYETRKGQAVWITWVESGADKPNFHTPESFGRFILDR